MSSLAEKIYESTKRSPCFQRRLLACYKGFKVFADTWKSYTARGSLPYQLRGAYEFDNRQKNSTKLVIILAGYKKDLWGVVFGRISQYIEPDCDVCVVTSGLVNAELRNLCSRNGWSYLSTKRNCLTLAQNIAIDLHKSAELIYKLDEDMFITKDFTRRLYKTYQLATQQLRSEIGFVAPLINVNGYCYVKILERINKVSEWENQFGGLYYTEGIYDHTDILRNPRAAQFMWGLDNLDHLDATLSNSACPYYVTPYRFSIGAILFSRKTWIDMGMFPVSVFGNGLGVDEEHFCQYCLMHTRAMVVAADILVGHLAFGPQTQEMLKYFHAHLKK